METVITPGHTRISSVTVSVIGVGGEWIGGQRPVLLTMIRASIDPGSQARKVGVAHAGSDAVFSAARAVGRLIETGQPRRRAGPQQAVNAWNPLPGSSYPALLTSHQPARIR